MKKKNFVARELRSQNIEQELLNQKKEKVALKERRNSLTVLPQFVE